MEKLNLLVNTLNKTNTTLLMGAGLSHEIAKIPLGVELAWKFAEDMGLKESKELTHKIEDIQNKFPYYQLNDFKTIAFALAEIDRDKLRSIAIPYFEKQTNNTLYASIGSLVNKKAINTIINYNFDELLEKYISCDRITSNEDYKIVDAKKPLHIKIHGTYSNPDSMRFLRTDWYRFEERVELAVSSRLEQTETLLVAGFQLNFEPFVNIVKKNLPSSAKLFVVNKDVTNVHSKLEKYISQFYDVNQISSTELFQELNNRYEI